MSNSRIKVAYLIPSGIGTGYTGPGIFLKRLLNGADDRLDPIIYAGLRPGHEHDSYFMPHRWMNFTNYSAREQLKWAFLSALWLIKDREKYDIVHFHGTYIFKLWGVISCILLRKPYVLVPLASNADMGNEGKLSSNKMVQLVRRAAVKRAAHGFALGESIVQELISSGMRPVDVTSIYNPVSEEFFQQESSHRLALKQITFVGVVGDRKQALLVLDVLAILRSKGLDARCAFYGPFENDAFAERFKTRLQKLKLENAVQHVPFTDSIHQVLLNDSSLFLLPSRQEGIPGALVEAMSAGVPCVVTNVGSMGSVVQEAGAGKVVPSDRDAIAEACLQLLSNPTLWHSESKKLKIFASENFRSQSVAAKYMGVLKKIR